MFIEISFVQSFVLFLGSPTHALSVTIFALLLFSSLGSLLSARVVARPERALRVLAALIVVLIALYVVALRRVFDAALHLDFPLRVAIAVVAQMPMGLTLGMFMPLGIACVARVDRRLVPWAWGINGVGSVAGTTLAVIIAMSFGFSRVAVLAALLYAAGAFLLLRAQRRAGRLATSDPPP
jgi:MFS family permease